MNKFKFDGLANIQHMNTRKQGPEDDKELAVDIKLTTRTAQNICSFFDEQLADFLFLSTGAVRNEFQEPISYKYELLNYTVTVGGMTFDGVTVKKISILPADGFLVDLTFQLSFKPLSNQVSLFAEYLQEMIPIKLQPMNAELEFA